MKADMNSKIGYICVLVTIITFQYPLQCQNREKGQIITGNIKVVSEIYVPLIVHSSDSSLYIPYCGKMEGGEQILCNSGAHLEVFINKKWSSAQLRTTYGILGAIPLVKSEGTVIDPKSKAAFLFQFSRRFYEVEPGQYLRIVIEAWPDEQSMKNRMKSIKLTSDTFKCPHAGIGRTSEEAAFFRDPPVPSDKVHYVTFDEKSEFSRIILLQLVHKILKICAGFPFQPECAYCRIAMFLNRRKGRPVRHAFWATCIHRFIPI
jgi:hypothetical protein